MARETHLEQKIRQALENSEPVEELVAECLELEPEACDALLSKLGQLRPPLRDEVREVLANLQDLGLTGPLPEQIPEQLGDFRLLERVGAGGMGVVYLAEQLSLGRKVALKLIRPGQLYFPGTRERFQREVRTIAQLQHPGIVPIYAVGEEQGIPYYAMRWIEGASLHEILARLAGRNPEELRRQDLEQALSLGSKSADKVDPETLERALPGRAWPELCLTIVAQIAEALHHAHERGVVHRDIKPSNIMLSSDGVVQLLDFGLASSEGTSQLTRSGALVGTLPYMSPEQLRGGSTTLDRRADVYALGVTLYELLSLRSPFADESAERVHRRILAGAKPSLRSLNRAVNWDTETVCLRALEIEAEARYEDAALFSADLLRARDRLPVKARRAPLWRRGLNWSRIHPGRAVALSALLLLTPVAVAFGIYHLNQRRNIEQLSGVHQYRFLLEQSERFWPVNPDSLEEMQAWITEVDDFLRHLPEHQRELNELRRVALVQTPEQVFESQRPTWESLIVLARELEGLSEVARELGHGEWPESEAFLAPHYLASVLPEEVHRETTPLSEEVLGSLRRKLEDLRSRLAAGSVTDPDYERQLSQFNELLDRAQADLATRRSWRFERAVDAWRHELLTDLVAGMEELSAHSLAVRRQLELTQDLERRPPTDWEEARRAIRADPIYDGLELEMHIDLEPLGRNPQSGLWEFVLLPTGSAPRRMPTAEDPGRLELRPENGMVLVLLPGGTLTMVDIHPRWIGQTGAPTDTVVLAPFFISKYEVTVAQGRALGFEFDAGYGPEDEMLPASQTWPLWEKALGRLGLELPTEAQWEYACRGGTTTAYFTGETAETIEGYANCQDSSALDRMVGQGLNPASQRVFFDDGFAAFSPVGTFLPNRFGLYDMIGNQTEWCRDIYVTRAYRSLPARPKDGLRETTLVVPRRVVRGGSYMASRPEQLTSGLRGPAPVTVHFSGRPVRSLR